jgi:hypothetical protein
MLTLLATRDYLDLGVEEKIPWSLIKFRGALTGRLIQHTVRGQ